MFYRLTIDVRTLQREGRLRPGLNFTYSITVGGERSGLIDVAVENDALQLTYEWRPPGISEWARGSQRVPIQWTQCKFGGARPWFQCISGSNGYACGRRVAKLYFDSSSAFACRRCCNLAYRSQSETSAHRAIRKAQKLRIRLGGGPSLLEPFPGKPPRMHRTSYYRLAGKALAAQERSLGLEIDEIRRRFPGLASEQNGFPPARDAAGRAKRSERFFTPRALAAWNGRSRDVYLDKRRGAHPPPGGGRN